MPPRVPDKEGLERQTDEQQRYPVSVPFSFF